MIGTMGQLIQQTVVQYNTGQVLAYNLLLTAHNCTMGQTRQAVVQYKTGLRVAPPAYSK